MAKKKITEVGASIGYPSVLAVGVGKLPVWDNNPDGVISLPSDSTDPAKGYTHHNVGGTDRLSFTAMIARGESRADGDVNVNTPNGVSSSKGQNKGAQWNYGEGQSGKWAENTPWDGGNITGT